MRKMTNNFETKPFFSSVFLIFVHIINNYSQVPNDYLIVHEHEKNIFGTLGTNNCFERI